MQIVNKKLHDLFFTIRKNKKNHNPCKVHNFHVNKSNIMTMLFYNSNVGNLTQFQLSHQEVSRGDARAPGKY